MPAVDDLPRQERVRAAVAVEVRVGVETRLGDGGAPVAAVPLGALDDVGDAAVAEREQALIDTNAVRT